MTTHTPRKETGAHLVSVCGRYTAEDIGDMSDARRDRFAGSGRDPTCAYCMEAVEAEEESQARWVKVVPQRWAHADIEDRSRRGEEPDRAQFRTWRSAIRVLTMLDDEGASVSSANLEGSNAPSIGQVPEGDKAQKTAARMAVVRRTLDLAFASPYCLEGGRTIPTIVLREILLALVVGRKRKRCQVLGCQGGTRCEKRQHHLVWVRDSWSQDERNEEGDVTRRGPWPLADAVSEAAGWPAGTVTVRHLREIERIGGVVIDTALHNKGLVRERDDTLYREANVAEKIAAWDLNGWDEIATALDVDESTAKRWEKEHGLPVDRYGGMVRARSEALREWLPAFVASRKTG